MACFWGPPYAELWCGRSPIARLPCAEDVRCRRLADPETDLEGPFAVTGAVLLALKLQRAHKPCGAGELIERKKPERVAHDNADTGSCTALLTGMAQPAQHHRKRCETEVGLGLATTRWEEQQIHRRAVRITRVSKAREVQ